MKFDPWREVINDDETYADIARTLKIGSAVLIGWTNGTTHFDVLFKLGADGAGNLQGGLKRDYLFVAIMRKGAFGFDWWSPEPLHPDYVGEKLFLRGDDATAVAELINGVIINLRSL